VADSVHQQDAVEQPIEDHVRPPVMVVLPLSGSPGGHHVGWTKRGDGLALGDTDGQPAMDARLDGIEEMRTRLLDGPRIPHTVRGKRLRQILQIGFELLGRH
jgi:hypothetical protein